MIFNNNDTTGDNIKDYLPIYLETLRVDSILDFDLFIRIDNSPVLYRSRSLPFTEASRQKLISRKVGRLYIPASESQNYQRYIEKNLREIIRDDSVPHSRKAEILYETSRSLVKNVLENPILGENIKRCGDLVASTVEYILLGREAFLNLLEITSFDYYTYTHSVNVCTFTIALAQRIGIDDPRRLEELGLGALLHDVGKVKIPESIIGKRGSLTPDEFRLMKEHPMLGNQILKKTDLLREESYIPVMQHHERLDGSGYPRGLHGAQVHDYGRIIAIADVFDALTSERVYQPAIESYPALKIMYDSNGQFDSRYLREFTKLMGPLNRNETPKWNSDPVSR